MKIDRLVQTVYRHRRFVDIQKFGASIFKHFSFIIIPVNFVVSIWNRQVVGRIFDISNDSSLLTRVMCLGNIFWALVKFGFPVELLSSHPIGWDYSRPYRLAHIHQVDYWKADLLFKKKQLSQCEIHTWVSLTGKFTLRTHNSCKIPMYANGLQTVLRSSKSRSSLLWILSCVIHTGQRVMGTKQFLTPKLLEAIRENA